jgi:hypothetical protein
MPVFAHHQHLLDPDPIVSGTCIGFQSEYHALFHLLRMIQGKQTADHRFRPVSDADAVAELEGEGRPLRGQPGSDGVFSQWRKSAENSCC